MCNSTNTTSKQAAQLASTYFIANSVLRNVPSLLLAFCCSAWSDGVGRTLPSIVSITGIILSIVIYMASVVFVDTPSTALVLILIASAVQGSFGDSTVVTMAIYSYITDQTTTQTRTRILGRLIGLNMFGNVIGSFMAGALMHSTTCTVTFSVALALMVISAGLCFVAMSG
jgi:MFS family permease